MAVEKTLVTVTTRFFKFKKYVLLTRFLISIFQLSNTLATVFSNIKNLLRTQFRMMHKSFTNGQLKGDGKLLSWEEALDIGVEVHLANRKSVQFVILICPFTSIRNVIKGLVGNIAFQEGVEDQQDKESDFVFAKDKMICFEERVGLKASCSHNRTMLYLGHYVQRLENESQLL